MARTAITVNTMLGAYGAYSAGAADITLDAGDVGNGNYWLLTRGDILVARNSHAADPYYITIDSVDDPQGRQEDITEYALAAADIAVFGPFQPAGWQQTTGWVHVNVENAAVLVGVLRA